MLIASIVLAGAIGAPARYLLDGFVQSRTHRVFPWGTFVVNASGSFLLGIIAGLGIHHGLGDLPRAAFGTGFCGAFTTFSTFSYESVRLLEEGSVLESARNVVGSVAAGLAMAAMGLAVTAAF